MRFPEFEGEWEEYSNHELFNIISEKNKLSKNNIVLSASQTDGMIPRDSIGVDIKYEEESLKGYKIVKKGDYIVHLRSFQGGFAFSEIHGICSPAYTILCPNNLLEYSFLKRYFTSRKFINSLKLVTYGIRDGKSISVEEWFKLKISIPQKEEQQKIIAFLSLIDERIETQNKIIEDLKKLKTALVDGLYASSSRSPRFRFQEFQKSWMQTNIGSITQNFNRRNKNKIVYPMFSVTNNSGFIAQTEKFGDREMVGEDIGSYKVVNLGEFAYNPARINVGSIARYNGNESCMISSLYVCFRLKNDINSDWALHLLKSDRMNFYYDVYGEGGVRVYLFYPNFARIKVSVPELLEQEKIGAMLSVIDQRIDSEINLNDKYKQQKLSLLRQMFI